MGFESVQLLLPQLRRCLESQTLHTSCIRFYHTQQAAPAGSVSSLSSLFHSVDATFSGPIASTVRSTRFKSATSSSDRVLAGAGVASGTAAAIVRLWLLPSRVDSSAGSTRRSEYSPLASGAPRSSDSQNVSAITRSKSRDITGSTHCTARSSTTQGLSQRDTRRPPVSAAIHSAPFSAVILSPNLRCEKLNGLTVQKFVGVVVLWWLLEFE